MTGTLTQSQFYMWRTLFALAHADNMVSAQEVRFMAEALEDVPFSPAQRAILTEDIKTPADVIEMFKNISNVKDQAKFFKFAHALVWADGDYGKGEQEVMLKLMKAHVGQHNLDDLIGKVDLELEDGTQKLPSLEQEKKNWKTRKMLKTFKTNFLGKAEG
jgi:hypothetical protein